MAPIPQARLGHLVSGFGAVGVCSVGPVGEDPTEVFEIDGSGSVDKELLIAHQRKPSPHRIKTTDGVQVARGNSTGLEGASENGEVDQPAAEPRHGSHRSAVHMRPVGHVLLRSSVAEIAHRSWCLDRRVCRGKRQGSGRVQSRGQYLQSACTFSQDHRTKRRQRLIEHNVQRRIKNI